MRHEASNARFTNAMDPPRDAGCRRDPVGQEPDCDSVRSCLVLGEPYGPEGTRPDLLDEPVTALHALSDGSTFARPASLRPTHAHCAPRLAFPAFLLGSKEKLPSWFLLQIDLILTRFVPVATCRR